LLVVGCGPGVETKKPVEEAKEETETETESRKKLKSELLKS